MPASAAFNQRQPAEQGTRVGKQPGWKCNRVRKAAGLVKQAKGYPDISTGFYATRMNAANSSIMLLIPQEAQKQNTLKANRGRWLTPLCLFIIVRLQALVSKIQKPDG